VSPLRPTPPTLEARQYAAELLRRLADRAVLELDAGAVPLPSGESIDLVAKEQVSTWLSGCATRLTAGSNL